MTALQAAEAFLDNLAEIQNLMDNEAELLVCSLSRHSAELITAYLTRQEMHEDEPLDSPEDWIEELEPITDPLEAAKVALAWVIEKAETLSVAEHDQWFRQ